MKYRIETRYEIWGPNGRDWSKWHTTMNYQKIYDSETDAKAAIKEAKEAVKPFDKVTKLKTEYKIVEENE